MRFIFGYIFCCLSSFGVCAQASQLDSLNALLKDTNGDERFDLLVEMVRDNLKEDIGFSLLCSEEAMRIVPELSDSSRIVKAFRMNAFVLFISNKKDVALPFLASGLNISRKIKNDLEVALFLNLYGIYYIDKAEYGQALKFFLESLILRESNDGNLGVLYGNIGFVYYKIGNNNKAIKYLELALTADKENAGIFNFSTLFINTGLAYGNVHDYDQAIAYIRMGLNDCNKNCSQTTMEGEFALGYVEFHKGDMLKSKLHFDKSIAISRQLDDDRFIVTNLFYLAKVYIELNRLSLASAVLCEAELKALRLNFDELLLSIYSAKISLYNNNGDIPKLLLYYEKYNSQLERLRGKDLLQQISAFEVDMEHEANLKTMAHQKQVLVLHDDSLLLQQRIYYGVSALIFLLAVILLLLWRRSIHRKKINELLTKRIIQRTEYLESKKQFIEGCNNELIKFVATQQCEVLRLTSKIKNINPDTFFYDRYNQEIESVANQLQNLSLPVDVPAAGQVILTFDRQVK